jgi:hypothetical protein
MAQEGVIMMDDADRAVLYEIRELVTELADNMCRMSECRCPSREQAKVKK